MTDEAAAPGTSFSASAPMAAPGAIKQYAVPAAPAPAPEPWQPGMPAPGAAPAGGPAASAPVPAPADGPAAAADAGALTPAEVDADLLDSVFWDGAVTPGRYVLDNAPEGVERSHEQELAVRSLFVSEQLPVSVGKHLSGLWNQSLANPPTPEQNTVAAQRVVAQLGQTERGTETLKLAQQEMAAIVKKNPAVHEWLEVSGLGNDRWLIEHLANRARARSRRAARGR